MSDVFIDRPRLGEPPGATRTRGPRLRALAAAVSFTVTAISAAANADAVTDWNRIAAEAAVKACLTPHLDPLHESRMYAMMHIAIHDALNSIDRRSRPYVLWAKAEKNASPDAAVAAAAKDVLLAALAQVEPFGLASICPTNQSGDWRAVVEGAYADALAPLPANEATERGVAIGEKAAGAILEVRDDDGADNAPFDPGYSGGTDPGEWRFTPDGPPLAFGPDWGDTRPFALKHSAQFRPPPPYSVSCGDDRSNQGYWGGVGDLPKLGRFSIPRFGRLLPSDSRSCERYAADVNEVKAYGGGGVGDPTPSARNDEQTEVALFWLHSSPMQWNMIARTLSEEHTLDLWENARLFGLVNIAMADGYIASFATKYHYEFWRPITAIREADTDRNPHTAADPLWAPLAPTPPLPDYESAHSVEGAAAATVMQRFFGADLVAFEACSISFADDRVCDGANEVRRSFVSLSDAAKENGLSRILNGFHFRAAVEKGLKHGEEIGDWTFERVLRSMD